MRKYLFFDDRLIIYRYFFHINKASIYSCRDFFVFLQFKRHNTTWHSVCKPRTITEKRRKGDKKNEIIRTQHR